MRCPSCGNEAPERARFCPECGSRIAAGETGREEEPSRLDELLHGAGAALTRARLTAERVARTVSAQQRARAELARLHAEEARLELDRDAALRDLGAAVYGGEAAETESARGAVAALEERLAALREEKDAVLEQARMHVAEVDEELRPTVAVTRPAQPEQPDPATEPQPPQEPWPPPDEGDPPQPAVVPEPSPQPVPEPYPPRDDPSEAA